MSEALQALVSSWRNEAERARDRYADERLAALCEAHASELETALRSSLDGELTLKQAAEVSGYSYSHLRRLLDAGELPNAGEDGRPRVRLGDLPFKPGHAAPLGALNAARRAESRVRRSGKVRAVS
jgi:hypothetical protein